MLLFNNQINLNFIEYIFITDYFSENFNLIKLNRLKSELKINIIKNKNEWVVEDIFITFIYIFFYKYTVYWFEL